MKNPIYPASYTLAFLMIIVAPSFAEITLESRIPYAKTEKTAETIGNVIYDFSNDSFNYSLDSSFRISDEFQSGSLALHLNKSIGDGYVGGVAGYTLGQFEAPFAGIEFGWGNEKIQLDARMSYWFADLAINSHSIDLFADYKLNDQNALFAIYEHYSLWDNNLLFDDYRVGVSHQFNDQFSAHIGLSFIDDKGGSPLIDDGQQSVIFGMSFNPRQSKGPRPVLLPLSNVYLIP